MHDHVMYLVNYQSVAHLEVLNYQSSSSYFTLRTGVISRAMDTLIFYSQNFLAFTCKEEFCIFWAKMESGSNQLFMLVHSLYPLFRDMSSAVEVTTSSGQSGQPVVVINSSGQTEVLNRCLETYLRCYCHEVSSNWLLVCLWLRIGTILHTIQPFRPLL